MTVEEHIHSALTAALAHNLAGSTARSTACVLAAAVPVLAGRVSLETVHRVAIRWLSQVTGSVVISGHGQEEIHPPPRHRP